MSIETVELMRAQSERTLEENIHPDMGGSLNENGVYPQMAIN